MTDFTGKLIANTYKDILTIAASVENSGIDSTLRRVQDGSGNNSPLKLSETSAAFTGNVSVNGNLTVNGSFQPDTVNTNELQATRISATSITTNHLNAGTLIFQDVSVSSLRTGNLYAATISAGTISATNINGTNITVDGDRVITSAIAVSAQAIFAAEIRATIANTSAALQQQIDIVSVGLSATNTQTQINATQINTLSTSIAANASAIAVNSAAITSINSFIAGGAFASAGTSATLETRIAAVSSTMATSINNSNTAITNLSATLESRIASTSSTLESHINTVSATLSSTNVALQTSIANVSSTMATSIANSNSAITALSATMATSINNSNTAIAANTSLITALSTTLESRIATVSSTMATSIANSNSAIAAVSVLTKTNLDAIASVNSIAIVAASAGTSASLETRIAGVSSTMATSIANVRALVTGVNASAISVLQTSVAANSSAIAVLEAATYASANTSATLETRIAAVSSTLATSIANSNAAIAAVSSTMATSINNSNAAITSVNTRINSVSVLAETKASAATSANLQTRINAVSVLTQTNKTSIAANASAIAVLQGITYASAGTSATLESRIAGVSSTMATSISNSNSAIATLSATMATSIANHLRLSGGTLTGSLTLNADPTLDLQAATKQYVDNLTASGIHFHESVRVENPGALTVTYNNGTAGVGATLTNAGTQAALVIDGITMVVDDRVLIYEQADATQNGVYVVTNVGSASTNWVLTRSSDTDTSGDSDANSLDEGSYFFVEEGNTGAGESYICNTPGTITFGTTEITFVQFSSSISYTAGTGININESRVISTSGVATAAQLASLSATMATSIANVSATLESRIATVSALIPTSLTELGIVDGTAGQYLQTNANGTYSFTSVAGGGGSGISNITAGTNIALTQNGVTVTDTTTSATINVVGVASAGTSAALESRIASVSSAMATSINNSNAAITALSATMATSINNSNTNIAAVSVLTKTNKDAITSINGVLGDGSTFASAGTSATLQTKIATLSATMATSINNSNTNITTNAAAITSINGVLGDGSAFASAGTSATLQTKIATLSATMATSIGNRTAAITSVNTRINSVSVLAETKASAATSANLQTRINAVSATMATSIANVSSALGSRITTLSATMATSISNKVSKSGDTMTGTLNINSPAGYGNLEIGGPSGAFIDFKSPFSDDYDGRVIYNGTNFIITTNANQPVILQHNNANKLTTTSTGINVTGTLFSSGSISSTPQGTLWGASNDGAGSGLDADLLDGVQGANYLRNNATNANATFTDITLDDQIISLGDTNTYIQFHAADQWRVVTGGAERLEVNNSGINVAGAIVASGNVTAFSDKRLKSDIETLDGSKVYEMRGVSYTKDGEASSGVIAQEIQKVAPELVNDSGEYLSVAYGNLVGYLIEGMKHLKQEVVELKAEVEQLKSEK